MNFIEQWFHISPDGGDGSFEVVCVVALALVSATVLGRRHIAVVLRRLRVQALRHD